MFNSACLLLFALAFASGAAASAMPRASDNIPGVGAAYFILVDPAQKIISLPIASDGTVGPFARVVSAGGVGARATHVPPGGGKPDSFFSPGPDPLFTQGSIVVNQKARILPGSSTISLFSIDNEDPTKLTPVGKPVESGGDFPVSVAINSKGTTVCALNGGAANGVNCFTVHPTLGLVPKPNTLRSLNVTQTTPPTGPAGSLSTIVFSPDESKLLVAAKVRDATTNGFVGAWDIAKDGSLSRNVVKSSPADGSTAGPFTLVSIPGTSAYVAADPDFGFATWDFGNSTSLSATAVDITLPNQILACWTAYSSKSGNFYIIDPVASIIYEVHFDAKLNPTIVKQYPQIPNSAPLDSFVSNVGNHAYLHVLQPLATSVTVLSVDRPGSASHVQTFNLTSALKSAGLSTWNNLNFQGMATFIRD